MNKIKTIIIDVREEFELLELQLISINPSLFIINIPMRAIFANQSWISDMSTEHTIYIMCKSGNRSGKIKTKYFINNENIKSLSGGIK